MPKSPQTRPKPAPAPLQKTETSKTPATPQTPEKSPTLAQKIADLNSRVEWFYGEDFDLDAAKSNYQSALALASEIESDLATLKNEITVLSEDFSRTDTEA